MTPVSSAAAGLVASVPAVSVPAVSVDTSHAGLTFAFEMTGARYDGGVGN